MDFHLETDTRVTSIHEQLKETHPHIPTQSENLIHNKFQCTWQVLEAVLTDFHLETDTRVTSIHEQLKETQLMLEDEVERLEEYFKDKVMEAEMRLDEKFEKVWRMGRGGQG